MSVDSVWWNEALQIAAQCWCDDETKDRVMDPALAEAFAKRLVAWMDQVCFHARNEEFYRKLLDESIERLGPVRDIAFTCTDGSLSESPIRLMLPRCISILVQRLSDAESQIPRSPTSPQENNQ